MSGIQVIRRIPEPWDSDLALTETYNFRRIMEIHLRRCDDVEAAGKIAQVLKDLSEAFQRKPLTLKPREAVKTEV